MIRDTVPPIDESESQAEDAESRVQPEGDGAGLTLTCACRGRWFIHRRSLDTLIKLNGIR